MSDMNEIGYLFTLHKRIQQSQENDMDRYHFITFGYYDGLTIGKVPNWYQSTPLGMESLGVRNGVDDPFFDQYTIKTIIPKQAQELEERGFCFDAWKHIGEKEESCPFISIASIHLSENFVFWMDSMADMTNLIAEEVKQISADKGIELSNLNCGIFPSLGYSDFVVAFLTDRFDPVSKIISGLCSWSYKMKPVLSGCYTVCGISCKYNKNLMKGNCENLSLSIKIGLKEGVPAETFICDFERGIQKMPDVEEIDKRIKRDISFGYSDCVLVPENNPYIFLNQYLEGGMFNAGNDFYKKYISDIRSTLGIKCEDAEEKGYKEYGNELIRERNRKMKEYAGRMRDLENYIKRNKKSIRLHRALEKTIKYYLSIAYTSHGFDVKTVFEPFMEAFIDNLLCVFEKGTGDDKEEAMHAITIFRDRAGDYLLDLIRSDKHFIEGNTLVHPSIGAATKLLFAYNALLQELSRVFEKPSGTEKVDKNVFLVTSGGIDSITSEDLFEFYVYENQVKPIVIVVPEVALYDIKGTLFRIFHEFMHLYGNRKREERYHLMVKSIGTIIAEDITNRVYYEGKAEKMLENLSCYCKHDTYERLVNRVKGKIQELRARTEKVICDSFEELDCFASYEEKDDSRKFYMRNLIGDEVIGQGILSYLSLRQEIVDKKENGFSTVIYNLLLQNEGELGEWIFEQLQKEKKRIPYFNPVMLIENLNICKGKYGKRYPYRFLQEILDNYWDEFFSEDSVSKENEPITIPCFERVETIIGILQECFSDVCAAKLLKMEIEDFLLAFIYGKPDLDTVMPDTVGNALRMRVDLKVLYEVDGCLDEKIVDKIKERIAFWKEKGYENYELMEDEYIGRLNEIFCEYVSVDMYRTVVGYVETYLQNCLKANGLVESVSEGTIDEIQKIYPKCNLETSEDFYETIEFLMGKWKGMAQGEKRNEKTGRYFDKRDES